MSERKAHPAADLFPMMPEREFEELKADIAEHGQVEYIELWWDGTIIDGRNRYRACMELGIEPDFTEFEFGTEIDPYSYVMSKNFHRRHLTASQKAAIAAELLPHYEEEAKERLKTSTGGSEPRPVAKLPQAENGKAREKAAEAVGVSPRYVSDAKKLRDEQPEEFAAVKAGEKTLAQVRRQNAPEVEYEDFDDAPPKKPHVSNNSGNDEWYTPPIYTDAAREVMGTIDLDPASNAKAQEWIRAEQFYTIDDDGLCLAWHGCVWLNPPYSTGNIAKFAEKLVESLPNLDQAIALVNNATETGWFQRMAESADVICLPKSRIKFIGQDGKQADSPLQGQAFLYFGPDKLLFTEIFSEFGVCAEMLT